MSKMLVAMLAGVFIGAFAMEILNRKRPGLIAGLESQAGSKLGKFKEAFAEGYAGGATEAATG